MSNRSQPIWIIEQHNEFEIITDKVNEFVHTSNILCTMHVSLLGKMIVNDYD